MLSNSTNYLQVNGKSVFTFDRQLILDLGVGLKLQPNKDDATVTTDKGKKKTIARTCKICEVKVDLSVMRAHVGCHILKQDVLDINVWILWIKLMSQYSYPNK